MRGADRGTAAAGRRAALFSTALAAALPILITVAARPAMYNGIRHFVFVLPPFAALGGVAAAWLAERLRQYGSTAIAAGGLALIAGIASPRHRDGCMSIPTNTRISTASPAAWREPGPISWLD